MLAVMKIKDITKIEGDSTFMRVYLVSEGNLWGAKIKIGIWASAVLNLIRKGLNFPIPLPYHVILGLMNMMDYNILELAIVAPLSVNNNSDIYRATMTIGFKDTAIEVFNIRASDAIILSELAKTRLVMETDLCVRLPNDEEKVKEFIDKVKPEDFKS